MWLSLCLSFSHTHFSLHSVFLSLCHRLWHAASLTLTISFAWTESKSMCDTVTQTHLSWTPTDAASVSRCREKPLFFLFCSFSLTADEPVSFLELYSKLVFSQQIILMIISIRWCTGACVHACQDFVHLHFYPLNPLKHEMLHVHTNVSVSMQMSFWVYAYVWWCYHSVLRSLMM